MVLEAIVLLTVLLSFGGLVGWLANYSEEKAREEYLRNKRKRENKR